MAGRRSAVAPKKGLLAAGIALFAGVAVTGTAFACTIIMGTLTLSRTSGAKGTVITTSASGLKAGGNYRLLFDTATRLAAGKDCMSSSLVLNRSVNADSAGSWSGVNVTVPAKVPRGVSQICGMENRPVKNATATQHDMFTVT